MAESVWVQLFSWVHRSVVLKVESSAVLLAFETAHSKVVLRAGWWVDCSAALKGGRMVAQSACWMVVQSAGE